MANNRSFATASRAYAIQLEEDKRIFHMLDIVANSGHEMKFLPQGTTRKRIVEICSRCGFRVRKGKKRKSPYPECPVAIVEKIMEC